MNLVPGALMLSALAWGLDKEPAQLSKLRHGDWAGILTVATGLGCLITLLEEGNRNDWFNTPAMVGLAATAAVMLAAGIAIELRCRDPFIDLSLLGQRGFGISSAIGTVFGLGMYGVMYVLPVYLAQIQGYNAGQIGRTIMWSGVPQLLMMPVAAVLAKRLDLRLLISLGLALFATSCLMNGHLTHWTAHDQLRTTQLIRALGMPLVIVPLTTLATRGLPAARAGSASALFNMLRNLGGSVGIALLATRIDVSEKIHSVRLGESISWWDFATMERIRASTAYFVARGTDPVTAGNRALEVLDLTVRREAFVLAFGDAFTLLGIILLAAIPLVWFVRPGRDCQHAAVVSPNWPTSLPKPRSVPRPPVSERGCP
jgi:DHA2 family multidrug resistance protein